MKTLSPIKTTLAIMISSLLAVNKTQGNTCREFYQYNIRSLSSETLKINKVIPTNLSLRSYTFKHDSKEAFFGTLFSRGNYSY